MPNQLGRNVSQKCTDFTTFLSVMFCYEHKKLNHLLIQIEVPSEEQDGQLQTLHNMHTQIAMHFNQGQTFKMSKTNTRTRT
jgi:hypothetical protein